MKYQSLKQHMNKLAEITFNGTGYSVHVQYNKHADTFETMKYGKHNISIGVKSIFRKDDIMFSDAVNYMISVCHECHHAIDFDRIEHASFVSDDLKSFCAEYDNLDYYLSSYYHSDLELNAQYNAICDVRSYLHQTYPDYCSEIDQHLLYWGKVWFGKNLMNLNMQRDTLDEFLQKFDEYRQTHWENAKPYAYDFSNPCSDHIFDVMLQHNLADRVHPYDFCFQNTNDAKLQRDAAFLINAETNEELRDLIPVLQDKSALQSVRDDVIDFSSRHSDLQLNLQQTMEKQ